MKTFKFLNESPESNQREMSPYDIYVDHIVRECINAGVSWMGYETFIRDDDGERKRLKIVGGINANGLLNVTYEVVQYMGNGIHQRNIYQLTIELTPEENFRERLT